MMRCEPLSSVAENQDVNSIRKLPQRQFSRLLSKLDTPAGRHETQTLRKVLEDELPTKFDFFDKWLGALADPSICITTVEDVMSLHEKDITVLPVPPVVKSLFRRICEQNAKQKSQREGVVLHSVARTNEFLSSQTDRKGEPFHNSIQTVYFQDVSNYRLILTSEEIATGVRIVASKIDRWCRGDRIVLVGVLTGAFMFVADLCRELKRPYSVQFVKASSYGDQKKQGALKLSSEIKPSKFVGPDGIPLKVILVDELLDNGKTLDLLRQHFVELLKATHTEADIITCCLFTKKREREYPEAHICGIPKLPDLWVNGYGLDDRESKRGWSELFATPKVRIVETIKRSDTNLLIEALGDNGKLTKTIRLGNIELTHEHPRLQVVSLDGVQVQSKAHFISLLSEVKGGMDGYYNDEVRISLVATHQSLVAEDEIFQGNELAYAEMRCALREQLAKDAVNAGVTFL